MPRFDALGRPIGKREGTHASRQPVKGHRASGKPSQRKGPQKGRGGMSKANAPSHRG
jgi:hypothetical protein